MMWRSTSPKAVMEVPPIFSTEIRERVSTDMDKLVWARGLKEGVRETLYCPPRWQAVGPGGQIVPRPGHPPHRVPLETTTQALAGPHDILIAATALRHLATLVTRNVREFSQLLAYRPNPSFQRTAGKLRLPAPSALWAPATPELKR
jgi:hypothetical protein